MVRKGSWETLIPENIGEILRILVTTGAGAYAISAMQKLAQNVGTEKFFSQTQNIINM